MSNVSGGPLPLRDGVNNEENPRTPNSCKNKKKNKQNLQKKFGNERHGACFFLGLCSNSWNWLTGSARGGKLIVSVLLKWELHTVKLTLLHGGMMFTGCNNQEKMCPGLCCPTPIRKWPMILIFIPCASIIFSRMKHGTSFFKDMLHIKLHFSLC